MADALSKVKEKLQAEIAQLEHELNLELPKEIMIARAHGDLPRTPSTNTPRSARGSFPRGWVS